MAMKLPYVRVSSASHQAISLGRAQRPLPVDAVLPLRKRTSGGGAVLLGPWQLRALLVLPAGHDKVQRGPVAAARWFGEAHRRWLLELGIDATAHAGPTTGHWACFAGRSAGELLVHGRKITGISQTWHRKRMLMWSATLLWQPPWPLLCAAFRRPQEECRLLEAATTNARDCLGHDADASTWATSLHEVLAHAVNGEASAARPRTPPSGR